jgi:sucrose-6-phosphate hydrolase SacC (GH32 family)
VVYDAQTETLASVELQTPLEPENGTIHLRMLLDRTSIEVFGNQGRVYLPLCILPADNKRSLSVSCDHGQLQINGLDVHELKSAWEQ